MTTKCNSRAASLAAFNALRSMKVAGEFSLTDFGIRFLMGNLDLSFQVVLSGSRSFSQGPSLRVFSDWFDEDGETLVLNPKFQTRLMKAFADGVLASTNICHGRR